MAPENTLEAFEAALRSGADGVELDVRTCATGEVVVCHDPTLSRLAGVAMRVRATGYIALRTADLGGGARVPTLDAVLELCAHQGMVNVEVKSDDVDIGTLVPAVARVLGRHTRNETLVSSFDPRILVSLRALRPGVRRGMLLPPRRRHPFESAAVLARLSDVAPHAMHPWHGDASAERIAWWRSLGLEVNVWTVDDPALALALRARGATTVITNQPGLIARSVRVEGDDLDGLEARDRGLQGGL